MPLDSVSILDKQIMFWFGYWAPGGSAFISVPSVLISLGNRAQRLIHHSRINSPQTSETVVSQMGYRMLANINHSLHRSCCSCTSTIPKYATPVPKLSDLNGTDKWFLSRMLDNVGIHRKTDLRKFLNTPTPSSGFYTKQVGQRKLVYFKTTHLHTHQTF